MAATGASGVGHAQTGASRQMVQVVLDCFAVSHMTLLVTQVPPPRLPLRLGKIGRASGERCRARSASRMPEALRRGRPGVGVEKARRGGPGAATKSSEAEVDHALSPDEAQRAALRGEEALRTSPWGACGKARPRLWARRSFV